jgi:hypothetical protein
MKTEGSLLCSKEPVTGLYSKATWLQSALSYHFNIHFDIINTS